MRTRRIAWLPVAGLFALAGCGGDTTPEVEEAPEAPAEPAPAPEPETGTVSFAQPADGSEVPGPNVEVVLETTGLRVVEAGVMDAGTGHHHIFLDVDVTPMNEVIPAGVAGIIHKGDGTSVHTLENVPPGQHRLIAVVADGMHIPLNPPVVDTIFFTVAGGGE
jgi:hypothetical protein